jgi:hypothetical protein
MSDCFKLNELTIPGTRQPERRQKALAADYVMPDERKVADLLLFIDRYAALIKYYELKGPDQQAYAVEGDWQPLIRSDEVFPAAGISTTKTSLPNLAFYRYVTKYETGHDTDARKEAYQSWWDVLFSLYEDIDAFYRAAPENSQLQKFIDLEIKNNLKEDFKQALTAFLYAFHVSDFVIAFGDTAGTTEAAEDDDYKFRYAGNITGDTGGFEKVWFEPFDNWWVFRGACLVDLVRAKAFFNIDELTDTSDRIDFSTLQLKQIFKRAFGAYARIVATANTFLQNSLKKNAAHQAHHGLLLTFIRLFGLLQKDINQLTEKHLNYYYEGILKLKPAPAVADSVHLVFEPAKNVVTAQVKSDSALPAGKDATGKPLLYKTNDELALNQAKIDQVKTLFVNTLDAGGAERQGIFASPVANSADGKGGAFKDGDTTWKAFGDSNAPASIGFYIASPVLHLTEGVRTVNISFEADKLPDLNDFTGVAIYYSGEKKWEAVKEMDATGGITITPVTATDNPHNLASLATSFVITFIIPLAMSPVVGYDPLVCDGNLDTKYPALKVVLNPKNRSAYTAFSGVTINKIGIRTIVTGITNLTLQSDLGAHDPTKPVKVFGTAPKKLSAFYMGHPELQHKNITQVKPKFTWIDFKDLMDYTVYTEDGDPVSYVNHANTEFDVTVKLLRNKGWTNFVSGDIYTGATTEITSEVDATALPAILNLPEVFDVKPLVYTPQSQNGFLQLQLTGPDGAFGHAAWISKFAEQTAKIAAAAPADPPVNTVPPAPHTPEASLIELSYTAIETINFTDPKKGAFFHLLPFGNSRSASSTTLLPVFVHKSKVRANDGMESALYIGIKDANIGDSVTVLMQLNEGSEDVAIDKAEVVLSYLATGNTWNTFDKLLLANDTGDFLRSGIIKFVVPTDADWKTTQLPSGLLWVRASVTRSTEEPPVIASDALPGVVAVYTNAVKATFADAANDPEHRATLLPNTISKLLLPDAAVKKISQPYASFGGRKLEQGEKFYTRASERLRHKNRAITIWDYEKLVLREFPEIYLVKCLNHTGYGCTGSPTTDEYREDVPGQVMLVLVPYIVNLNAGNIFQPTISKGKCETIQQFIAGVPNVGQCEQPLSNCNKYKKGLHCQLSTLWVESPRYETLMVECSVKLKPCFEDKNLYADQLRKDVSGFLAPWIKGDEGKIRFGGKIHTSQVVYFIEQLEYVDYVTDMYLHHTQPGSAPVKIEADFAVAGTSRSVLTSVNINEHAITVL